MKRFYKSATVAARAGGYCVLLDASPVKTPANNVLVLPSEDLARAIAEEWQSQVEEVRPQSMPMLRLANSVIDGLDSNRATVIEAIMGYGANDLLCYRAHQPLELVNRQNHYWNPILDWAAERYGARLRSVQGLIHIDQSPEDLESLRRIVESYDAYVLGAVHVLASITGSLILALAVAEEHIASQEAFALARLDECFQAEKWGADTEAEKRASALGTELDKAAEFIKAVRRKQSLKDSQ